MFGFTPNQRVKLKDNEKYEEVTIIRNFVATTCYLVKADDGKEFVVDRNDLVKER